MIWIRLNSNLPRGRHRLKRSGLYRCVCQRRMLFKSHRPWTSHDTRPADFLIHRRCQFCSLLLLRVCCGSCRCALQPDTARSLTTSRQRSVYQGQYSCIRIASIPGPALAWQGSKHAQPVLRMHSSAVLPVSPTP